MPSVTDFDSTKQPTYEAPEPFEIPAVRAYARAHKGTIFEQARAAICWPSLKMTMSASSVLMTMH